MAFLILFLIVVALLLCFFQYSFYYTRDGKLFNKVPGPYKLPIIGNIFNFLIGPVEMFYTSRNLGNVHKRIYSVQICYNRILNVLNPEDSEIVLSSSKHITKSLLYSFLHPWLQQGLLTSKGEKWHQRRKILTPAFHFNILKQFCRTFEEQGQNLIDGIKLQDGEVVSVIPVVTQFALNSICETAMGTQVKSSGDSSFDKYKKAVYEMGNFVIERIIKIWIHSKFFFKLAPMYYKQKKTLSVLHGFTTSVIRQRRKERDSGVGVQVAHEEEIENDVYMTSNKKRLAMLDLLLAAEAEGKIDESGIREEVDTFMFEGHDTTAMAISFALMLLANNKNEQVKIAHELEGIFGNSKRATTVEDLNNMKYLEMCIKECLRLYPSVPLISRQLEEDVQLTDYLIPANTICHIHIFDLHRDPSIFHCPDDFIPERFSLENSSKRHAYAYIPFSAGPRNCIGQRFAMYELKSVLSNILRNFILEAVTKPRDIVFSADLVLRSRDPIYVKFVPKDLK